MALDATVSGSASDSYATLAEATAYHAARLWSDEWGASTDPKREAALKWATRLIDQLDFPTTSQKAVSTQALRWPRSYVYDPDGARLPTAIVPAPIREACCELAYYLLKEDRAAELEVPEFQAITVGPIDLQYNVVDRYMTKKSTLPRSVVDILRPYLVGYGSTRVVRA
ncbi:MAG: hypothetical protein H6826_13775 [Planctomycetes bacterium]|nr:hypothetical protein [Planctomycetota bacterium]